MSRWRSLATASLSAAVHAGALIALLLLVSRETPPPALFVELTDAAVVREGPTVTSRPGASDPKGEPRIAGPSLAPTASRRERETHAAGRTALEPSRERETSASPSESTGARDPNAHAVDGPTVDAASPSSGSTGAVTLPTGFDEVAPGAAETRARPAAASTSGAGGGAGVLVRRGPGAGAGAGAGGPGGGLALAAPGGLPGDPGAEYAAYLARVRRRIQESLTYPEPARRRSLRGTVHLEIVIRPDGAIGAVSVVDSSSHRLLDEAAVETVRGLGPTPFPPGVRPRPLRVRLPVVFELQ